MAMDGVTAMVTAMESATVTQRRRLTAQWRGNTIDGNGNGRRNGGGWRNSDGDGGNGWCDGDGDGHHDDEVTAIHARPRDVTQQPVGANGEGVSRMDA